MAKRLAIPVILALALLAALAAAAAFSSASVSFRSAERDGDRVAEVLIGERPVIVLRTSAGGYSRLERAEIVANRLRAAMGDEIAAEEVRSRPLDGGGYGVFMGDRLIVAVYEAEADAHGATPEALADLWRDNLLLALGYEPPAPEEEAAPAAEEEGTEGAPGEGPASSEAAEEPAEASGEQTEVAVAAAEPAEEDLDWTGSAQKWVPIFSLEREGARIGMAQVAGPTGQLAKVKGVAQLRLDFRNIGRIYAYIPVSTISLTKLDRVQGVSVWALADVKVLNF